MGGSPEEVWQRTAELSGISKELFDSYYAGKEKAIAYRLGEVSKYESPKRLADVCVASAPNRSSTCLRRRPSPEAPHLKLLEHGLSRQSTEGLDAERDEGAPVIPRDLIERQYMRYDCDFGVAFVRRVEEKLVAH